MRDKLDNGPPAAVRALEHPHGAAALDAPLLHHQAIAAAVARAQADLEGALADAENAVALADPVAADAAVEPEPDGVGGDGGALGLDARAEPDVAAPELDGHL